MNLISQKELKAKIDSGDDFKLVMTLGEFAYQAKHIPGSIQVDSAAKAKELLSKEDEIIIYCASPSCAASPTAYHLLTTNGYKNVRRYAGGIEEWENAGLPIESSD